LGKDESQTEVYIPPYLEDNFLKLHHLKQGFKCVEEYTRNFK